MSTIYDNLETLRTRLSTITGVQSCAIGLEPNIAPEDYPIIRLVPSLIRKTATFTRAVETLIYFGKPVHESDEGLPAVYDELLDMEQAIVDALDGNGFAVIYLDTITDEDRVEHYKLMAVHVEIHVTNSC